MNRPALTAASFLGMVFSGMVTVATGAVLPRLTASYGVPESAGGPLMAAQFGGFLAGVYLYSRGVQRRPAKGLLLAASLLLAGAMLFLPMSPGWAAVQAASIGIGIASGALNAGLQAMGSDLYPEARGRFLSFLNVFFGVGALGQPLLAKWLPWQTTYQAVALVTLVFAGLLATQTLPAPRRQGNAGSYRPDRLTLLVVALIVCYTGAESSLGGWLVTYVEKEAGWAPNTGPVALSAFWMTLTLGRVVTGLAVERIGYLTTLWVSGASALVFLILGLTVPGSPIWAWAAMGLSMAAVFPTAMALAASADPGAAGPIASMVVGAGGIGATFMPLLVGLLSGRFGLAGAIWLLPGLLMVLLVLLLPVQAAAGPRFASN